MEIEKLKEEVIKNITMMKDYSFPPVDFFLSKKTNEELIERLKKAEDVLYNTQKSLRSLNFHLALSLAKGFKHPENKAYNENGISAKCGDLVSIRPCGKEYDNKTYLGFYLGDIALSSMAEIKDNEVVTNFSLHNPAIFVPELKKVIFGAESWWGKIKSEEDFRKISDEDIKNTWYVKALQQISESE